MRLARFARDDERCYIQGRLNSARLSRSLLLSSAVVALQTAAAGQVPARGDAGVFPAYTAPAFCPDAASWVSEILARVEPDAREQVRVALPGLVDSLDVSADGKRALLRVRGAASARMVTGAGCTEVLAGAALIVAIAFSAGSAEMAPEPETVREPAKAPQPASLRPSSADAEAPVLPKVNSSLALESTSPAAVVAPDSGALEEVPVRHAAARWAIGAGAGVHTGVAPGPAGVVNGEFELGWPERSLSVRARGSLGWSHARVRGRSARFQFVGGSVDLCPLMLGSHLGWQWSNCIGFELGQVHAEGDASSELRSAEEGRMWWAAPGLVTRLQSPRLLGIRIAAEAGASLPLWRREFEFHDADASVYETPLLALTASLGLQVPLE